MLYELLDFTDGQFPGGLGWHDKILEGFPQSSLWSLSRALGVEPTDTAALVGVPVEDVAWRKRGTLMSPAVSDKLFQIARAYGRLVVPFKDVEVAKMWLRTAQPVLGGAIPIVMLTTLAGASEVFTAIAAIKPVKSVEMNPIEEPVEREAENLSELSGEDGLAPRGDEPSPDYPE